MPGEVLGILPMKAVLKKMNPVEPKISGSTLIGLS